MYLIFIVDEGTRDGFGDGDDMFDYEEDSVDDFGDNVDGAEMRRRHQTDDVGAEMNADQPTQSETTPTDAAEIKINDSHSRDSDDEKYDHDREDGEKQCQWLPT